MMELSFQLGTAISIAYDENGMLGVQVDGHGDNAGGAGRYAIGSFGLIGRPLPATEDGLGAVALYCDEGRDGFAWIGFDYRDQTKVPPLSDGSVALYNSGGQFWLLDYEAETATLYVPMDDASKAHTIVAGKDSNGKRYIEMRHSDGGYITITEDSVVVRHAGNAYIEIKGDEIALNGTANTTAGLNVGGAAAQPVTNNTLLTAAIGAVASAATATGSAPVTGASLGALLGGLVTAMSGTGTSFLKGL